MKLISTLCFSLLFIGGAISQEFDTRLLQRYTELQLINLQQSNPEEYGLLAYALDNGIYFTDIPKGKEVELTSVSLPNATANFITLGLEIKEQNQYFLVREENKMLVVKSRWVLNHEMNKK